MRDSKTLGTINTKTLSNNEREPNLVHIGNITKKQH